MYFWDGTLVCIDATVKRISTLKLLGKDIHGLDIRVSDKQLFSVSEERLCDLPVDMGASAILIFEGVKYAEGGWRDFECEPRCGSRFRLYQWAG